MSANSENKLTLTHITPNSYRPLVRRWRCWATCCCTFVGHLHENRVETLPLKSVGSPTTWLSLLQRFALTRNTRTETQSTNWSNVSKSQHHTEGNNIHTEDLLTLLSCEVPHLTLRFFLTKPLLFQWPLMVLQNSCVGAAVVCCACLFFSLLLLNVIKIPQPIIQFIIHLFYAYGKYGNCRLYLFILYSPHSVITESHPEKFTIFSQILKNSE